MREVPFSSSPLPFPATKDTNSVTDLTTLLTTKIVTRPLFGGSVCLLLDRVAVRSILETDGVRGIAKNEVRTQRNREPKGTPLFIAFGGYFGKGEERK